MTFQQLLKEIDKKYDIRFIDKVLGQSDIDILNLLKEVYDAGKKDGISEGYYNQQLL